MPIYPENFVANSLSGTILVTNGFANVTLPTNPFALEGDKNFVIRLRKGGVNGLVIATSPTITVRDTSQLVSLTANISTVAEGNLVTFTLVTANATNNSNVFYSVFPVTANVNTADFVGANVGRATIINNQATFTLFANADLSLMDETNETFRVQLRENSPTGNIIFNTSNVVITDVSKRINVFGFVESARSIVEGTSVTFTVSAHNIATGTLLYYYTSGNADITGANIGSVAMNSVSNTITITTASTIPANQSRVFNLVLSETNLGAPIATSNTITVADTALAYLNATGGTESTIDGFKIHTFTTSNIFSITNFATASFNTADVLVIAGGGGGGRNYPEGRPGGGGGAGGFVSQTSVPFSTSGTYSVIVGGGGTRSVSPGGTTGSNGSNSSITAGSNFANILAVGGGGGGAWYTSWPANGGSGGGGFTAGQGYGFPSPTQQGFPGSSLFDHPQGTVWQGGGGAGGAGIAGSPPSWGVPPAAFPSFAPFIRAARGGAGANSNITGSNVTYAGGGGGGSASASDAGPGGGGYSGQYQAANAPIAPVAGKDGGTNRGGGGGGGNAGPTEPAGSNDGGSGGSGIVIIRYPWRPPAFFSSVTANNTTISHGSNAFFVVNTLNANATTLFYDTVGNVTSASFVGGNTGSFTVTANATVIRLQTVANIPNKETRNFQLRIREDSATGNIALISSEVVVAGNNYVNQYIQATGGTVTTIDGFRYHTFTSSNTFSITNFSQALLKTANIFAIAGGGGGGGTGGLDGAGGGGGGYVIRNNVALDANSYTITIGSGGAGSATPGGQGTNGANTSITAANFANVLAVGGGGGGGGNGRNGGSGGGGTAGGSGFGFPGPTQQGFPGGSSPTGGGGGGSEAGASSVGGKGGDGIPSTITGANVIYAGGGGGGRNPTSSAGFGGAGGGGPARNDVPANGTDGLGGGGGGSPGFPAAGTGGSGVVIIRYPWVPPAFFTSVTPNVSGIYEGANAFFVVNTTFANATTLFYDTVGNVTSSNFVGGNTGSFIITSNATVLRLETVANIPLNESRVFALRIREDSATGNIALISSNVGIFDANLSIYINATGGNVFTLDGYRTHIFTASNNFVVNSAGLLGGNIEYMIVAGGGGGQTGGQNDGGGGGGAGGLLSGTSTVVANTYVVTVGSGGGTATSGSNSSVLSLIAVGGGAGGATNLNTTGPIGNGGSGGGSSFNNFGTAPGEFYGGGAGIAGQGNPGGRTPYRSPSYGWGGGGGGAGGAGGGNLSPSQSTAVVGGVGISSPLSPSIPGFFGTPGPAPGRWFAGGGGTGGANFPANSNSPFGAAGGAGGGGKGGDGQGPGGPGQVGMSGNVNTGGGGGAGGGANPTIGTGGSGGSGIVIIRYPYA